MPPGGAASDAPEHSCEHDGQNRIGVPPSGHGQRHTQITPWLGISAELPDPLLERPIPRPSRASSDPSPLAKKIDRGGAFALKIASRLADINFLSLAPVALDPDQRRAAQKRIIMSTCGGATRNQGRATCCSV